MECYLANQDRVMANNFTVSQKWQNQEEWEKSYQLSLKYLAKPGECQGVHGFQNYGFGAEKSVRNCSTVFMIGGVRREEPASRRCEGKPVLNRLKPHKSLSTSKKWSLTCGLLQQVQNHCFCLFSSTWTECMVFILYHDLGQIHGRSWL